MSLNDHPDVWRMFEHFKIEVVQLAYTAKKDTSVRHSELLISNYAIS